MLAFYVNGSLVSRQAECEYSIDCPVVGYIKRNKFLYQIKDTETVSATVFYKDTVSSEIYTVCNNCQQQKQQQMAIIAERVKQNAL